MISSILLQSATDIGKSATKEVVNGFKGLGKLEDMGMQYLPKIIAAVLIGLVGFWLIKWVMRLFRKLLQKQQFRALLICKPVAAFS